MPSRTSLGVGRRPGKLIAESAEQHGGDLRRDLLRENRLAQHDEVIPPRRERAGADEVDHPGQIGRGGA
jgi:hypothetical protein